MSVKVIAMLMLVCGWQVANAADCSQAMTQMAMNGCADQTFRVSDKALNAVYREVVTRLKTDQAASKLLVTAQRAWLAFRDAECAFSTSGVAGGTIQPMMVSICRDTQTQARTKALQAYLSCKEGDLACPVPPR